MSSLCAAAAGLILLAVAPRARGRRRGARARRRRRRSSSTTAARSTATSRRSRDFEQEPGIALELRGGTAPELFERLRSRGRRHARRPARDDRPREPLARQGGRACSRPSTTPALERQVPAELPRPRRQLVGRSACASARRCARPSACRRTRSAATRTSATPRWKGKLCLRTSNNEYNQSLVADWLAKRGAAATERLLRSWMANEPQILGSDVDVLEAIAAGRCDVGLTNHYYLGARSSRRTRTSRSPPHGPTRTARARTRTSPASASSRAPSTGRTRSR